MESPSGNRPSSSSSSLLGSLRTAVKKVRFLLSFSATRWILSSIAGRGAGGGPPRRVSFNSRPSLLDADESIASASPASRPAAAPSRASSLGARTVSRTSSAAASELSRTSSAGASGASPARTPSPGYDDDVDRRAELFIANFYRHIQMERQVSLQLRYCQDRSLERTPSR